MKIDYYTADKSVHLVEFKSGIALIPHPPINLNVNIVT